MKMPSGYLEIEASKFQQGDKQRVVELVHVSQSALGFLLNHPKTTCSSTLPVLSFYCLLVLTLSPSSLIPGYMRGSWMRALPSSWDFIKSQLCHPSVTEPWMGMAWGRWKIKPALYACFWPHRTSRSFWDFPGSTCTIQMLTGPPAPSGNGAPHASRPAPDLIGVPVFNHNLKEVFSKKKAPSVSPHHSYDCTIDLIPDLLPR